MSSATEPASVKQNLSTFVELDGYELKNAFEAGTRLLEKHRDAINALNVFPVPDGDTGTNMLLTMRSVNEEMARAPDYTAGAIMEAMAHGALLGARGNSGVILSQFFKGLAQGLHGKNVASGEDLVEAFAFAAKAANNAVGKPVEGTMLTVIGELSMAAAKHAGSQGHSAGALSVWLIAQGAAKVALARTPLQLPVLREAGVVDAGGQGVVTLLDGVCCYLVGGNVEELEPSVCVPILDDEESGSQLPRYSHGAATGAQDQPSSQATVQDDYLTATEGDTYGYCTQFLITGHGLEVEKIKANLSTMADSTVVVGDENLVKVHLHALDPGPVISYGVSLGTIVQMSMDDMDQQHKGFVELHRTQHDSPGSQAGFAPAIEASQDKPDSPTEVLAVVAVARGDGFIRLFNELGCSAVVPGGQTMNPSARELIDTAMATAASNILLLPNNSNIVPTARQASELIDSDSGATGDMSLHTIPSRSLAQGVAALLAFNPDRDLAENLESMGQALSTVTTVEVTKAVRPANIGGVMVQEGQYISLLEGDLVAAASSPGSAFLLALTKAVENRGSDHDLPAYEVITLYWGEDIGESQADQLSAQIKEILPTVEVEVVYGGQPSYQYIVSLE